MHTAVTVAVLAGGLLAATPARADLKGKTAPEFEFKASWNTSGEKGLKDFKGRVILVEMFATW